MKLPQQTADDGKKSLFLDTATQVARHWHSEAERSEIEQQLHGRRLYCSRYVKCQYKVTLLNSIIHLHNLLLRSKDLQQAEQKATEGRFSGEAGGRLTPGDLSRIVSIAFWISRQCKTYEEQLDALRDLIEDTWETLFHYRIESPLVDATGCMYAEGYPKMGVSGAYDPIRAFCNQKSPPECRIGEFWQNHRDELSLLATMDVDSITVKRKDTRVLREVKASSGELRDGKSPYGNTCRDCLSDAIICIESQHCPEPVNVHSINRKHFEPLGKVLGVMAEPSEP